MARLVWDKTGERWWETGCSNGVLYTQKTDGTYNEGVAWNGLTGVTESPGGAEANDMYADDIKYASIRSAETFSGTIEAYTYPDEFLACDGGAVPTAGVILGQQSRTPFGFVYKTKIGNDTMQDTDDGYKLHIIYNATASPSEKGYQTINESPEAITFSWEITTTPIPVTDYKPVSTITVDTRKLTTEDQRANLVLLEAYLFGRNAKASGAESWDAITPTLLTPDQVIALIKDGTEPSA